MKRYQVKEFLTLCLTEYDRGAREAAGLLFCILAGMLFVIFRIATPILIGYDFDLALSRLFYSLRGARPAPADIVIVGLDDESYHQFSTFRKAHPEKYPNVTFARKDPFPRTVVAEGIAQMQRAKPKIIIQDLYIESEEIGTDADQKLIEALRMGPTVIGKVYTEATIKDGIIVPVRKSAVVRSEEKFRNAATQEILTMLHLTKSTGAALHMVLQTGKSLPITERIPLARPLTEILELQVASPKNSDLINYYGPPGHVTFVPFYKLFPQFDPEQSLNVLKEKIVFFGYQSNLQGRGHSDKDQFPVPYSSEPMFGVEIHATIAANLLDGSFLKRFPLDKEILALFLMMTLLLWFMNQLRSQSWVIATPFLFSFIWFVGSYIAFARYNYFLPGALACFAFSFVLVFTKIVTNYAHLLGNRRELERLTR